MRIECLLLLFFNDCENQILYLKPLTSIVPRDGTLNKHGTQRWNLTSMIPRGGTLNMHGTQRWNFKQAWYPEMEL
jgi:hypothetical protein